MSAKESKKMSFYKTGNSAKKNFTGFFVAFSVVLMIFGTVNFKPETAEAIGIPFNPSSAISVPAFDASNFAANSVTAVNTTVLEAKESVLDGILTAAMKIMIQSVTNSIVSWINSGFQGSPAFVTDPAGFLTDVADQVAGNFIAGTELGFMCEPFALDVRFALNLNYSSTFKNQIFCRLSDVIGNAENFAKFTAGDFSQGGWGSWFEITQNPQNNPLGAYIIAQEELTLRTARGQSIELKKLDWGKGFLSYRECIRRDRNGECAEYGPIQTPGSVVESQLNNALFSGQRQLELADEINEIVGALIGQLAQTVLTQGLSSFGRSGSNNNLLETPLSASCSPDRTTAKVGENVLWRASVFGGKSGTPAYLWSGDESLAGTGATAVVAYATRGTKTATVQVTKGGEIIIQDCLANVSIPEGPLTPPLAVLCSADRTTAGVGENVRWTASVIGGSANSGPTTYIWNGVGPINGATTAEVDVVYADPGLKTAGVEITRNEQTVSQACFNGVTIPDPPITASCSPDRTTAKVGDNVRWTATVTGAGAGQESPRFYWTGNDPITGRTTQVANVIYTSPGMKNASVRVTRYAQVLFPSCSYGVDVAPRP